MALNWNYLESCSRDSELKPVVEDIIAFELKYQCGNPFSKGVELLERCWNNFKGKPSNIPLVIINELEKHSTEAGKFQDENIKISALNVALKHKDALLVEKVCRLYRLSNCPQYLETAKELVELKKSNKACLCASSLNLQENFTIEELHLDVLELELLSKAAFQPLNKSLLEEILNKKTVQMNKRLGLLNSAPSSVAQTYAVKIINYGWDQSDNFVTLFVTLNNVQSLPSRSIKTVFTPKSLELVVSVPGNKNYCLKITNLLNAIDPDKSHHEVKQDMVVVIMRKQKTLNWASVSAFDQKKIHFWMDKEKGEEEDPSQGPMTLMKKTYEDGDDEMKRSILKAWFEAKEKQTDEPLL